MNLSIIFTICKGLATILLFIAIFNDSQNIFSIIKVIVTAVAIWGIGIYLNRDREKKQNIIILLFYVILFFLFNPIYEVSLEQYKWITIDFICGLLLILSIIIHEPNLIAKVYFDKIFKKSIFTFGLLIIILGFYLTAIEFIEPLNLNYLKKYGKQTIGRITKISPNIEINGNEEEGIIDAFVVSFDLDYQFNLQNENNFFGKTEKGENPMKNVKDDEFTDKYGIEYMPSENENYPIQVYYQLDNPVNNRSIYDVQESLASLLLKATFPYIIITGFIMLIGFITCKKVLKNEIITNQNI